MGVDTLLTLTLAGGVVAALLLGFPVAFTLGGGALLAACLGATLGVFDLALLGALPSRLFGAVLWNEVLAAIPLFIVMGLMLERSRLAEDLLQAIDALIGRAPGGLALGVTLVGMLLAASTGVVGASIATLGLLALPTLLQRGYAPSFACGTVAAAGTLGQIIPPSIVLVILGDQLTAAWTRAQREIGVLAPEPMSVGDLFAGALLPGLLLVALYLLFQFVYARLRPQVAPDGTDARARPPAPWELLRALVPTAGLILAVLGAILAGLATPTEAAALGAAGATLLAGARVDWERRAPARLIGIGVLGLIAALALEAAFDLRLGREDPPIADQVAIWGAAAACLAVALGLGDAVRRLHRAGVLTAVNRETLDLVAMIFTILIGASVFSLVFRGLGGEELVADALHSAPGGVWGATALVLGVMIALGFFLDFVEICFVVVPIAAPMLLANDVVSPIWLGVMMAVALQSSFLTPPFGFALFYLRGVAPEEVATAAIHRGALPYVALQIAALGVLALAPPLATWLPARLFGGDFPM
ncbi:MAG: TRAP transporter large permease subunit [Marivibrio sp.]|uniref:TRAP transporter large permease n=1 Tax=Marivibrio sp. TaxID=2039719 RepID=UPI0032EB890F